MSGDCKVVSDATSSVSVASRLIITLVTSISCEMDDGEGGNDGRPHERVTLGSSVGSCFTLTRTTGSGTCPPLFLSSSCIFSASTSFCFCLSILVSSSICLSFSRSILSLSTVSTGPVVVVVWAVDKTGQGFCRQAGFKQNWQGAGGEHGGSSLMSVER